MVAGLCKGNYLRIVVHRSLCLEMNMSLSLLQLFLFPSSEVGRAMSCRQARGPTQSNIL
jgi:hypothetical protein